MLINLLRNAWQACDGRNDGAVRIGARLNRRNNVVIEVADNGTGIPDNLAKKMFVPFFTTKERGSGVGLALARQVMIALRSGASGAVAGHAVWQEAAELSGEAQLTFLRGSAYERMAEFVAMCNLFARPWTDFHTPPE